MSSTEPIVKVEVTEGVLEGLKETNKYGGEYYSFRGIPYAECPQKRRFMSPQPKTPWKGIRRAMSHDGTCYQYDNISRYTKGYEDCLYLNIYTPEIQPAKPFPVMFWIHGGGLMSGSGNDNMYGPEFLLKHEVILVTINYRLDVFGFLCLHNKYIPGNAGMKDQVAALRWVNKNIGKFGGNPENITIFGGESVVYHCLSPMSKGLFKRAIMQSFCVTSWMPDSFLPRERGLALAKELGCYSDCDSSLYNSLKMARAQNLVNKQIYLTLAESAKTKTHLSFGVVKEKKFKDEESFLTEDFYDALRNGFHEGVDIINGYTEHEGIMILAGNHKLDEILAQADRYPEFFIPKAIEASCSIDKQLEAGRIIKQYYFQNEKVSNNTIDQLLRFVSAESFIYPILMIQKMIAKSKKNKLYLYKFTCKSKRNVFTEYFKLSDIFKNVKVVCHGDDLPYIFPFKELHQDIEMNSSTYKMIDKVTRMWTNFAKFGDPTPVGSKGVKWLPYTTEDEYFMDIGEDLKIGCSPNEDDVEFWDDILKKYCPHLFTL